MKNPKFVVAFGVVFLFLIIVVFYFYGKQEKIIQAQRILFNNQRYLLQSQNQEVALVNQKNTLEEQQKVVDKLIQQNNDLEAEKQKLITTLRGKYILENRNRIGFKTSENA